MSSYISLGQFNIKVGCLFIAILLSLTIFFMEHYSMVNINGDVLEYPIYLFTFYYSFSFLGNLVGGGICRLIIYIKEYPEKKLKTEKIENSTSRNSLANSLIFNENTPQLYWYYFAFSALFEFIINTANNSFVVEAIDLDSIILLSGLNIIFIKFFNNKYLKYPVYRHQLFPTLIISIFLLIAFAQRYSWLIKLSEKYKIKYPDCPEKNCESDLIFMMIERLNIKIPYRIFSIICLLTVFIFTGISICYDKYIIQKRLCSPFILIFYKGVFGFPISLIIQIIFSIFSEKRTGREKVDFITLPKQFALPIKCINSHNFFILFLFFIFSCLYKVFFVKTIDYYPAEILGFLSVISSIFASDIMQIIYLGRMGEYLNIFICFIILFVIIFLALVACEIIILHFWGFDQNIKLNIDKRASKDYLNNCEEEQTSSSFNSSRDLECEVTLLY